MEKSPHRAERLADQIREEVAEMIAGELNDPRIGFAAVTGVELSSDLRHARVLVSVMGNDEEHQRTLEGLASAARYVRHEIARRLRLRRAPELAFVLDRGVEEGRKIESLLRQLRHED